MKQDQAPQSEALETWNTLEAEFNDERKAMLMASAETDAIKEEMNKKHGPGTIKYGSEIKQPEIKTPQAIFEFSQRNPAAEGGRMLNAVQMGEAMGNRTGFATPKGTGVQLTKDIVETVKKKKVLKQMDENPDKFASDNLPDDYPNYDYEDINPDFD